MDTVGLTFQTKCVQKSGEGHIQSQSIPSSLVDTDTSQFSGLQVEGLGLSCSHQSPDWDEQVKKSANGTLGAESKVPLLWSLSCSVTSA